jgi:NADPH-dependent 7-cyano-7-deazaguanine reductase QueF-like protein
MREKIIDLYLNVFNNSKITEEEFNAVKYEMYIGTKNFPYESPYTVINDYFYEKLYNINHTNKEIMDALSNITYNDIYDPKKVLLTNVKLKVFTTEILIKI